MESSTSSESSFPGNRLIAYLQSLAVTKQGLPHGLPVCVAASHTITTTDALVQLASAVGPHIAIFKVFADIVDDWSEETVLRLKSLARKHSFLIWEGGRILNSTVNVIGKQGTDSREVKNELVDLIRKKYTKGVIRPASWAVIATAWASGVAVDNQEADILIPTLKAAARETVADTVQTIRTEITADSPPNGDYSPAEAKPDLEPLSPRQHLTSDYVAEENGLGLPLRKASTISLTQTITQHSEDSSEVPSEPEEYKWEDIPEDAEQQSPVALNDDLPSPPLLARGLVLCLPSVTDPSFTPGYRQSCIAAARANQDFILGFLCSEPWHMISQQDDIFEVEPEYERKIRTAERVEDNPHYLAVFSLVSHRMNKLNGKHISEYDEDNDNDSNIDELSSPTTPMARKFGSPLNPMAEKLHAVLEQAIKFRDASSKSKDNVEPDTCSTSDRRILHIPIVSLP
ncbi:hypothetical protein ASPWEDRAFT_39944 [Aspergillus wentii DTO 134E9]|uniref:Uncharacterized protein n=1 Tax=Aspergillus wentii DTO 134E9 TaxID=1073089 RepID=A0A1L9RIT7_ASPWE|nr:uncharacterized protein ASPWEDRAFT_39944 [Aspergillus wentii DTO 134E9]KAI9932195.1 hypothetical protein MW887_009705 [Aspergillus wentii]OJJ34842.1 hypothetical protein ASPWEDRAFT_39944 [Aspergillus wentii DTO 134E9]